MLVMSDDIINQVMYAPSKPGDQPSVEVSKEFMMSPNKLHLECSLDKELYYHGETISVNVHIQVNIKLISQIPSEQPELYQDESSIM